LVSEYQLDIWTLDSAGITTGTGVVLSGCNIEYGLSTDEDNNPVQRIGVALQTCSACTPPTFKYEIVIQLPDPPRLCSVDRKHAGSYNNIPVCRDHLNTKSHYLNKTELDLRRKT